ncbi:hypothetical protein O9K51_07055 [Purpureocillium lavendulum]|uniref:Uncharacterized protein n=1 Tax=Purpureocillium lavendulum TaxID=1247861 RepID=A0AB34FR50_9HYPO|nr:hypothetical protein O9K51_07055 [Purpureocillium lavendulum]
MRSSLLMALAAGAFVADATNVTGNYGFTDHHELSVISEDVEVWSEWHERTIVRISDYSHPWPVDPAPWDLVEQMVRKHCGTPVKGKASSVACNARGVSTRALLASRAGPGSRPPGFGEVRLWIEGVFNPDHPMASREVLTKQLVHVMKSPFHPMRRVSVPSPPNGTRDGRPLTLHTIPKAIMVGNDWVPKHEDNRTFLAVRVETEPWDANEPGHVVVGLCKPFGENYLQPLRITIQKFRGIIGYTDCMNRGIGRDFPELFNEQRTPSTAAKRFIAEEEAKDPGWDFAGALGEKQHSDQGTQ